MWRLPRIVAAWATAWAVYLLAAVLWAGDGLLSLVFQPLVAVVVSTVAVVAVLALGLVLRIPPLGRLWHSGRRWAVALATASLAVMALGSTIGLTGSYEDPETGQAFTALHPAVGLAGYVLLLFAIAHWPHAPAHLSPVGKPPGVPDGPLPAR